MRAGLSTIQQTLTPEAATVLNQSIAEAGRRSHGQTTPLHVAATLLASPSGYLRQACIRSHPNSSHPLQCRALELCFSVALDRLPSAQNLSPSLEPPISNALMAALKRAQAHQRRGCPEQQQQPLLAVKVELEQLIISILDDPSVSRVMREASFSSPAVKATIEQSLNSTNSVTPAPTIGSCGLGLGFRSQSINRNGSYLNPRLQSQGNSINSINSANSAHSDQSGGQGGQRREEVKKVVDVMLRNKKRNPVLVGESEPELVVKELLQRIERKEVGECIFRNVQVVSLEKEFGSDRSQIPMKIKEIGGVIDTRISIGGGGVILNLGDLKWLVEQPVGFGSLGSGQLQQQMISETGKVAVVEMGKLLARFGVGNGKLWLIGTATCETYLRCQVYHPSMENDWDLQALPIAARAPLPGMFPRMGGNGILSSSVESLTPLKNYSTMTTPLQRQLSENMDPSRLMKCCHSCMRNYELELARLKAKEFEKSPSEAKPEPARQTLPQWLQIAKPDDGNIKSPTQSQVKDQELAWKQKTEELQRKWNDTCARLHPNFHHSINPERNALSALSMRNLYNPNPLGSQVFQPKSQLARNLGGTLRLQQTTVLEPCAEQVVAPPGSPVRTDLALGCPKISENTPEKTQGQQCVRNFIGQIPSESQERLPESKKDKLASILDPDSFKSLFKGLAEKVSWQNEAASAIAATVIECRSGNSKRQSVGGKGDAWLLFAGPDRVGKRKMAMALSELVCRRSPVIIQLGSRSNDMFRGKTSMDRVVEAVQRNPSSVVVLEDFDQADTLIRDSIKRAFERGRLPDFHGREVSLKNVIFILTANRLTENLKDSSDREQKLAGLCHNGCQLDLSVTSKTRKRSADWHQDSNRAAKSRTDAGSALAFDLNEEAEAEAEAEDDRAEGSLNSSDLTVEHDHEQNPLTSPSPIISIPAELLSCVDEAIVFKPVDFGPLQNKVANTITTKFSSIVGEKLAIEVENEALEQVLGSIWFGPTELEDWAEKILVPSFQKLKNTISSRVAMDEIENVIVRLASLQESGKSGNGDLLPSMIRVTTDGL